MARKIPHLHSPADTKDYGVPKSSGAPKVVHGGFSPAQHQKSYGYKKASGETPTSHAGVDLHRPRGSKPNLSNRRG